MYTYNNKKKGDQEDQNKEDDKPTFKDLKEKLLLEKRAIFLWDEVNEETAKETIDRLLVLENDKPKTPIHLHINSPGGAVTHGMAIYDTMQLISSPVSTICVGLAASMGSVLFCAGQKGKRYIFPHGEVMIHQPLLGGHMRAVAKDLEIEAMQMEKTKQIIAKLTAKHTGQPLQRIVKDMDRNYWMSANESIDYGIADHVVKKIF